MEKLCVIFGAGETFAPQIKFNSDTLIIAADGGYNATVAYGLEPSVIVGDFDSGTMPERTSAHVIKLNCDKDDTDTLAAIKLGLRRGYRQFVIYGGVGGRLDHTMANIAALRYLNDFDAQGFLIDQNSISTIITNATFKIPRAAIGGTVSVFAYGGAASGVSNKGLKFPLDDAELYPEFPVGVSNVITDTTASVTVKDGSLLIFFPKFKLSTMP